MTKPDALYIKRKQLRTFKLKSLAGATLLVLSTFVEAANINIGVEPLDEALNNLAKQTGVQIIFASELAANKKSTPFKGELTASEALAKLLTDTDLIAQAQGKNTFTIVRKTVQKDAEPTELPEISVKATVEQESAYGPVKGYVAKRSATGTKTDTPLIETTRSISVITSDQMDAQQVRTMQDALAYTAGIVARTGPSAVDNSGILIRGFSGFTGDFYYRDGLRVETNGWWNRTGTEPYGLERVEVLRGPASILYGQGQPNGTVNMVSKRPTDAPLHEISIQLGSFDRKQIMGDFGGKLDDEGVWSYRLTGLARDSSTQIDFSEDNRYYLAGSISYTPSESTKLILRTEVQKNEGESNNNLPAMGTALFNTNGKIPEHRALNKNNQSTYENVAVGWTFEHAFNDVITARQNFRLNRQTGSRFNAMLGGYQAGQERVVDIFSNYYKSASGNYTALMDNQLQAKFDTHNIEQTVLLGFDYMQQSDNWKYDGFNGGVYSIDLFAPVYPNLVKTPLTDQRNQYDKQAGLYLQDQLKFDKHWLLSLGARKDWAKNNTEFINFLSDSKTATDQKSNKATYNVGLGYLFDSGITPYASYATSFKPTLGTNLFGVEFKPETGTQYELGVKYQPPGSNTLFTAAVFDLRRQNVTTVDPNNLNNQIQKGEVQSQGFELEAKTQLFANLSLIASYTYADAEITKDNGGTQGNKLTTSPKQVASTWLDYTIADGIFSGLGLAGGVRYIGSSFGDDANSFKVSSYTLIDAALRYDLSYASAKLKGFQMQINANNLTDKKYFVCNYGCQFGAGRAATATLKYEW